FKLIGVVKKALDLGTLLVADEMDAHLHPLLTKHLVSLFDSTEFNPKGAQLIFTSHSTNLLDLDFLRRDQIWFTEKDEQTAATDLFSLYDFSIRKDTKVEKGYLIGRFGAIPFIKGGL
ncbi:ATP/GTP-binding protein, partial [Intestinimonas butyriciproducens]